MLVSSRTTNILLVTLLAVGITIVAMLATGARSGPLDPLSAPASTDGVKLPGTPISAVPFTITQPGAYYLTRDLSGAGIGVASDHVTIDLMGFTLTGAGAGFSSSGAGVGYDIPNQRSDITIRNGTVREFYIGIDFLTGRRINLDNLRVIENGEGIRVGVGGVLSRLVVRENATSGIELFMASPDFGTDIRDSIISHNGGRGIDINGNNVWVHDSIIDANGSDGIRLWTDSSWNKVTDNRIVGNVGRGVHIDDYSGSADPNVNLVARNALLGNVAGAVLDTGTGNRIGTFVGGDASITASNPWSNVVY